MSTNTTANISTSNNTNRIANANTDVIAGTNNEMHTTGDTLSQTSINANFNTGTSVDMMFSLL